MITNMIFAAVFRVHKEFQVYKDHRDFKGYQDHKDQWVKQVCKDHKDFKALLVSAILKIVMVENVSAVNLI